MSRLKRWAVRYWFLVEIAAGVMVACIPLPVLFWLAHTVPVWHFLLQRFGH